MAVALAGCAATAGPEPSTVAIDLEDGAAAALRGARTVWIAGAVSRTGALASGADVSAQEQSLASGESADIRDELAGAVRQERTLQLASTRDAADLVLYFERADRLRCFGCQQPEGLWYWWGLVADRSGREIVSLHGETDGGAPAAARQFVKSVTAAARRAGRGAGRESR
jgi:hypothetical protein